MNLEFQEDTIEASSLVTKVLLYNIEPIRVWRRFGERLKSNTMQQIVYFGGGSIMMWTGMIMNLCMYLKTIHNGGLEGTVMLKWLKFYFCSR